MKNLGPFLLPILLFSCGKEKIERSVPQVEVLSQNMPTRFCSYFEEPFEKEHNAVFSSTTALAWSEMKRELQSNQLTAVNKGGPLVKMLGDTSLDFQLLPNEYTNESEIGSDRIRVNSGFTFKLPFKEEMIDYSQPMVFSDGSVVDCFGPGGRSDQIVGIPYYLNDSDVVVEIALLDANHRLFLMMCDELTSDSLHMEKIWHQFEIKMQNDSLRDYFEDEDELKIPKIALVVF